QGVIYAHTLMALGLVYEALGEPALAEARMRESIAEFNRLLKNSATGSFFSGRADRRRASGRDGGSPRCSTTRL
ncbi:MAG: hypothetical protein ACRELG_11405, partial [Gemmataceae bacterium]